MVLTRQKRMSVTQFLSLFSYVTVLVLCEGSVSHTGNKTVQCAKTTVKVHGQCFREASLCQAVETFSLALTCSPCSDKDVVTWFFSSGHPKEDLHHLSQETKTLLLPAVNVTKNATGCYQCQCGSVEGKLEAYSVQVDQPGPPTFLVQATEDQSPTDFDLVPPSIHVSLDETSPGVVCINCSATGYPNLHYKWSYKPFSGEWKNMSSDPCLGFYNNQPEVLCFTPTIQNVQQQLDFRCEVSNIVQTVTAEQTILYSTNAKSSDWFVRPHPMQSQEAIPLTDGTATANCAAYQQTGLLVPLEYYVCALPDTVDAGLSACLFNSLTCCSCHDESCPLGINVTRVKFNDSVGIVTDGCRVDSTVQGSFVCMVEKTVFTYSAKQYIGTISFGPEMHASQTLTLWELGLAFGGGGVIMTAVVFICSIVCIVGVCRIICKTRRREVYMIDELCNEGTRHMGCESYDEREIRERSNSNIIDGTSVECVSVNTVSSVSDDIHLLQGDQSVPTLLGFSLPSSGVCTPHYCTSPDHSQQSSSLMSLLSPSVATNPKVHLTEGRDQDARTEDIECSVDDMTNRFIGRLQLEPMGQYSLEVPPQQGTIVLKLDTFGNSMRSRTDSTDSRRRGEALYQQVQRMQSTLSSSMHLDADLLAKLNERRLLTPEEYNDINAHLMRNNIHAAGTHFVNSVLIRWPYGVYEGNVCKLLEALESHSDRGNHYLARKLRESFSECEFDFPCAGDGTPTQ